MGSSITTRAGAVLIVIVIHALSLLIFENSIRRKQRSVNERITYFVMVPTSASKPSATALPTKLSRRQSAAIEVPDVTINVAPSSPVTSSAEASIDWDTEAKSAAKRVAKNQLEQESKKSLDSKPKTADKSHQNDDRGIFDRGPPHPPGTSVDLGGGVFQTWVNDYCYISSETNVATGERYATLGVLLKYRTKCVGPRVDGSNMFERFRPQYLKKSVDDNCAKNMTECNHSSASSPH